jgi:hypothetical protein
MTTQRVEMPFTPRAHQRAAHALRLVARFLVLVWHRRGGKTVFAVMELVLGALACTKEDARFGYICPWLKQSKGIAWPYLQRFARAIPGASINQSDLAVTFPNGATVRLFGADNPDAFRGLYFDGVVLDEVAQMHPEVWGEILRPALADRLGWAIFIGTPKGVNLFSELYFRAQQQEGWAADLKRGSETGMLDQEELDQMRAEMTEAQYAQEIECDFNAAVDNVLLRLDDVLEASQRTLHSMEFDEDPKVIGVDVARFGDDATVIVCRQGKAMFRPKVFQKIDTMRTASEVALVIQKEKPQGVFIDQTGVGSGVVDRLQQLGFPVVGVDNGSRALTPRYVDRRAEMWWAMADWVRGYGCIPNDTELIAELCGPTYRYDNHNKLRIESKEDMKKRGLPSPNKADALSLTFAAPVAHAGLRGELDRLNRHAGRDADYDPYARDE